MVDDEEAVLGSTVALLRMEGYTVVGAADGCRALELLGGPEPFDLVLADLAMSGIDGRELGQRILVGHPELPLLLISGYFNDLGVANPSLAGSGPYLAKPFSREELLQAVHRTLGRPRPAGEGSAVEGAARRRFEENEALVSG